MTKNLETISEAITNPKHAFPKADSQPSKRTQHRYDRRKAKEFLHWNKWGSPDEPSAPDVL